MSAVNLSPDSSIVRRLQDLLEYPREDLDRELKGWLDLSIEESKANIAKAILALANYGGYITIGFTRDNGNWIPAQPRPSDLSIYTQDIVNGIIRSYAEPAFHCEVHHIPHPRNGDIFPLIIIPGKHRTPIRAKRDGPNQKHVRINIYYTRRPGPSSEAIQTAQEWDELINRCMRNAKEDLLNSIREILLGIGPETVAHEKEQRKRLDAWGKESTDRFGSLVQEQLPQEVPSRYSYGTWLHTRLRETSCLKVVKTYWTY
jgi:hypothetical protein